MGIFYCLFLPDFHRPRLDVHDENPYFNKKKKPVRFQPGMILTVEPGLYISPSPAVDKRWHNIGIRIEDDVLITENGNEVLSATLPKTVADIEKIMTKEAELKSSTAKTFSVIKRLPPKETSAPLPPKTQMVLRSQTLAKKESESAPTVAMRPR